MKFISFISFLILFFNIQLFSQDINNEQYDFLNLKRSEFPDINSNYINLNYGLPDSSNNTVLYRIPVKFWIFRKADGSGGISHKEMKDLILDLNYYHSINNTGFRFYMRPDFVYIDNNRLYKLNYISESPFQTLFKRSKGCINVFIPEKLRKNRLFRVDKNTSGTYNTLTKGVIWSNGSSSSTLSHEIGHYLGLQHPHRNWRSKLLQEPVSREETVLFGKKKKCECRGDKLCDTPAEPNLTRFTDNRCKYTGWNVKDKHGIVYKPDVNNIMSYTKNRECRDHFTKGQIEKMRHSASKNKYHKIWSTLPEGSEKFDFDFYEPDDYKETASELFFNTIQTHTFHKICTSKRKAELSDTTDWLYFNMNSKIPKEIFLIFKKGKYDFSPIEITVYEQEKIIFSSKINKIENETSVSLGQRKKGTYYIKITQNMPLKHISGYALKLVK